MAQLAPLLAETTIFGDRAHIKLLPTRPTEAALGQLFDTIAFIDALPKPLVLILDLRDAPCRAYLPFLKRILERVEASSGQSVKRSEVWVSDRLKALQPVVQPIVDSTLHTQKMQLRFC